MKIKFCMCGGLMEDRKFFFTVNVIDVIMCLAQIAGAIYSMIKQFNITFVIYCLITFVYMCFILSITCKTFVKKTRLYTKRNKLSFWVKLIAYLGSFYGELACVG